MNNDPSKLSTADAAGDRETLELRLTVAEANLVLEALGEMSFRRVYTLVAKLQEQAARQLAAPGDAAPHRATEPADERHAA